VEFRFDAIICSNVGNENSDVGLFKYSCGLNTASVPLKPHPKDVVGVFITFTKYVKISVRF